MITITNNNDIPILDRSITNNFKNDFKENNILLTNMNSQILDINKKIYENINIDYLLYDFFSRNIPSSIYIADRNSSQKSLNTSQSNSLSDLNNIIMNDNATIITTNNIKPTYTNRTSNNLPYFIGTPSNIVTWPDDNLKPNHTLVGITKYNDITSAKNKRILQCNNNNNNYIYGHWNNKIGIGCINRFLSDPYISVDEGRFDWLVTCIRSSKYNDQIYNSTNRKYDAIFNNIALGDYKNSKPAANKNGVLNINGYIGEESDFIFSLVFIFDLFLSDNDMLMLSNIFNLLLINPSFLDKIEKIILEINNIKKASIAFTAELTAKINASKSHTSELEKKNKSSNAATDLAANLSADNLASEIATSNAAADLEAAVANSTLATNLSTDNLASDITASKSASDIAKSNLIASNLAVELSTTNLNSILAASELSSLNVKASTTAASNLAASNLAASNLAALASAHTASEMATSNLAASMLAVDLISANLVSLNVKAEMFEAYISHNNS